MAKREGEPTLDSEQEEIALSDSELDNVLKSADITNEDPDEQRSSLEQYGVWVKVEPHDLEEEATQNMSFELSDLDSNSESALTEEEEQLLGELEEDEESDLGDLSGLEDDLEELGKGNAFAEQGEEEELSVEDLDVDLEELSEESLGDTSDLDDFPDLGGEEDLGLEMEPDTDIEVPLSDSSIVEEHYEDLATVEGVPSTPGRTPSKGSSDILEKIEKDLIQIKTEIQSLKNELAGLGKAGASSGKVDVAPAAAGGEGFFERGEDETIALTGDELDNILNTADVTEEVELPEESLETLEEAELPDEELAELEEQLDMPGGGEEEIMELGSLDMEAEEAPEEEASPDDDELSLEELGTSETDDESIEIDIGAGVPEEGLGELSAEAAAAEGAEAPEELGLEELEELDLDASDLEDTEAPGDLGELSLEEPAEELELEDIEELELEEPGADQPDEQLIELDEPGSEELSLDESGLEELDELGSDEPAEELDAVQPGVEEPLDELSLEESGLEETEAPEELAADELDGEELEELDLEEAGSEEPNELGSLEEPGIEEAEAAEELEMEPEELSMPKAGSGAETVQPTSDALAEDLKSEIKSILSYFDQLLEDLPEAKIKEFAQSEYFVRYQRLFKELGLGA
jgi:pilus assembly protein FimV